MPASRVDPPARRFLNRAEVARTTVGDVESGDGVLVARLAAGDDEAVAEIFDRYGPFLYGLARRVTGERTLAEEVVQDVLTTLWSQPERFDPARGTLRAFLGVQAHRRAVDAVRRDVRRDAHEARLSAMSPAGTDTFPDATDAFGQVDLVRQAIGRLPAAQRQAVELAYYYGCTQIELATALGIPVGTVKSRLRLAQAKLVDWLAPQFLEMA